MLLKPGLADADKAGAQVYIEASPAGLPVYLKYGWKPVDEIQIDMRPLWRACDRASAIFDEGAWSSEAEYMK